MGGTLAEAKARAESGCRPNLLRRGVCASVRRSTKDGTITGVGEVAAQYVFLPRCLGTQRANRAGQSGSPHRAGWHRLPSLYSTTATALRVCVEVQPRREISARSAARGAGGWLYRGRVGHWLPSPSVGRGSLTMSDQRKPSAESGFRLAGALCSAEQAAAGRWRRYPCAKGCDGFSTRLSVDSCPNSDQEGQSF